MFSILAPETAATEIGTFWMSSSFFCDVTVTLSTPLAMSLLGDSAGFPAAGGGEFSRELGP